MQLDNSPHEKRANVSLTVHLILRQVDQVLLLLRQNTGYCDGMWGFLAGQLEDGESNLGGVIRAAKEKAGIEIDPSELSLVHVLHRQKVETSNESQVDLFFECRQWRGLVENLEPEKCKALNFFFLRSLPSNLIGYVKNAFDSD